MFHSTASTIYINVAQFGKYTNIIHGYADTTRVI